VRPASDLEQSVAAFLYAFGARGYDIQLMGGYYRERFVAGAGFAGDFRGAGIKGELSLQRARGGFIRVHCCGFG